MSPEEAENTELAPGEHELIELIGAALLPAPADARGAARFARELEQRIERRRRVRSLALPAAALATAALAALLWSKTVGAPEPGIEGATLLQAFADPHPGDATEWQENDDYLPDDYRALASLMETSPAPR